MANTKTKVTIEGVVEEETLTLVEIADLIKADEWEETTDIKILDFYKTDDNGEYTPDRSTRFQVRNFLLNPDFVNEKVEYVRSTGDESQIDTPTVVRMPDGTYKLDDGSHTIDIKRKRGDAYSKAYVVDYEKHLGGKDSNAFGLGNLLNIKIKEKQTAENDDIKNHFLQILAEKRESGLPTAVAEWDEGELNEFLNLYSTKGISVGTLAQWQSRTPEGGRHLLPHQYTETQLRNFQTTLSQLRDNKDYLVTLPRELNHASNSILGQSILELAKDKSEKNKLLILLYCKDNADLKRVNGVDGKGETKWKKNLEENYRLVSELTGVTIKYQIIN
tara:strand:+ start:104 stop:1099 length:996 start_codon:yes stop_codon:yes gene_type:complete